MNKLEWIERRAAYLIRYEQSGITTAATLAKATADAHESVKGFDISLWPEPEHQTRFNTNDNSDIGINDAEPEEERPA